eukprot:339302_1
MFCFPVSSTFVALLFATIHTIQSSSYFSFTVAEAEFSKNSAKYSGIYNGTLTLYSDVPDTALTAPFDPYTNDWTTTSVSPLPGIESLTDYGDHNWAQVDRLLYIIGQYRTTKTNVMYIYDLVSKTTTLKTPPNEQCVNVFGDCSITRVLAGGCVAYDPSRALIWYLSGYDVTQGGAKRMSQTYSISSQTWTDRPDMVWGTICGSCAMDQTSSSVYVFAGGDTCASDPNGGVQRYQYSADEWTMIISGTTTGIKARLELRCVLLPVNGYIYCMGGSVQFIENNNRFMESTKLVEVFNPATGTVIQTFNLNNYRERFQFVLLEPDCLYIFGGYAYVDRKYLDLTEAEYVGSCPTKSPTTHPTKNPTESPTKHPTKYPTIPPTKAPTKYPTASPTKAPTKPPSAMPTENPTRTPTKTPTKYPTTDPTKDPTIDPTVDPTTVPTQVTLGPSSTPSVSPSSVPSLTPSSDPSVSPSFDPSVSPSFDPSGSPTEYPSLSPTEYPNTSPSSDPTTFIQSESDSTGVLDNSKAIEIRVVMVTTITTYITYFLL